MRRRRFDRYISEINIIKMADVISKDRRSYNMSRIRSMNTKPELKVRSILHRQGYRFTVNGPKNKHLPGKPDIVLPKFKTVVFVHGCFWHCHSGCKDFRLPKTRTAWWKAKLDGNVQRDSRIQLELCKLGWEIVVIWECELKGSEGVSSVGQRLMATLK